MICFNLLQAMNIRLSDRVLELAMVVFGATEYLGALATMLIVSNHLMI